MSSQKPRIIPWLYSQIDSKVYPGLEWMNQERTQFRVPWKHARRQDLALDDSKIFEAWAMASGCYDPSKDQPDLARWKRNFRSALLRKEEIRMIQNHSTDPENPHKIYEFTIPVCGAAPVDQYVSADAKQDLTKTIYEDLENLDLYRDEEELYAPYEDFKGIPEEMDPNKSLFAGQVPYDNDTFPEEHLGGAAAPIPGFPGGAHAAYSDFPSAAAGVQVEQVPSQPDEDQETFQQKILKHFSCNSFQTDFEVQIFYRGKLVQTSIVTNPHGFYITADQQPGHSGYLDRVYLPQPASVVTDQLLTTTIGHLLTNLKEGTLVEVREGIICAKRFGLCRSYWSLTNMPETKTPNQIDKREYSFLYSIHQFITGDPCSDASTT
ncbi:interferon regulatory factor 3-like isoform 2-T2 [Anomaloglossus baeobatrachus]|uniref:interferon regulatory factor 3-like isoform X2 n=1 Tax=Anomaloglossus baeobatrachus TaxID=238106 RepID=UPI003F50D3B7